jgi:hypothetical protein
MSDILNKKASSSVETEKALSTKLSAVKNRVAKTWELYYDNLLPKEDAAGQIRVLTEQQNNLEIQLANVSRCSQLPRVAKSDLVTYLHKCRKDLESNDPNVQRSLIDTFVDKVLISNDAVTAQIRISPKANADSDKVGGDDESRTLLNKSNIAIISA